MRPLYGARQPSLIWLGGFYLPRRFTGQWALRLELMWSVSRGNRVCINGVPLGYLPNKDTMFTWMDVTLPVPEGLLRPGYNELTIEVGQLAPDYQKEGFTWDDVQFRRIRLERCPE